MVQLSHLCMTTRKTRALTIQTFVDKVMSLLFNMLYRFVIAFLPRSKHLLVSQLQSPPAVILELKKMKSHCFHFSPSIYHEVMGPDAMILVFFECWVLSQLFYSPLSPSSRGSLVLRFLPLEWYHLHQFSSVQFSRSVVSDFLWPPSTWLLEKT